MCTMTWFLHKQGYELFFNRDEQLSRRRAELPKVQSRDGYQYISPTDTDAGGTWIAVNEFGVSVCLLNHYEFQQISTYKDWISRGEIVRKFATVSTIANSIILFNTLELSNYRAFRMFVIEPNGTNVLFVWDGHKSRLKRNVTSPKSSSSVNAKHVKENRKQYFESLKLDESNNVDDYLRFHASHDPKKSEQSVCMHRDDANTVSLSHIRVDSKSAQFLYMDGAPCEAQFEPRIEIDLTDSNNSNVVPVIAALR